MSINSVIKKLYKNTAGPIDYINNIIGIVGHIYALILTLILLLDDRLSNEIQQKLFGINSLVKVIIASVFLFFIFYLLSKLYSKLKYVVETYNYTDSLSKYSYKSSSALLTANVIKSIPPSSTIGEVYKEFEKRAHRWATDSKLYDLTLYITVNQSCSKPRMSAEFVSPRKNMSVNFETKDNFKVMKDKRIKIDQLRHTNHTKVASKPFFKYKKWRVFIKECLERTESETAGNEELRFNIDTFQNQLYLQIHPSSKPKKVLVFFLSNDNSSIYSDSTSTKLLAKI